MELALCNVILDVIIPLPHLKVLCFTHPFVQCKCCGAKYKMDNYF